MSIPNTSDLLIANLRILDLHRLRDWPDITSKTFATRDTHQQNQKQRIKCTEWIIYRLFELWDPDETRDKLQPFFPPLEPLQSLNLRAAEFRCLNELKKNGILGRESVLRKTMLDECKPDAKLMELLLVFSSMVVRRVAASSSSSSSRNVQTGRSVAERMALANGLSGMQQGQLAPLCVVHAAGVGHVLRKREEKRERYRLFDGMLDGKRAQLRQRVGASVQRKRRESNVNEEAMVKKVVQDNWVGGGGAGIRGASKWESVLLMGDDVSAGDAPLMRPFEEVWRAVDEGRPLVGEGGAVGLLAGLERRVQVQRERLQMWQEFHEGLRGPTPDHHRVDEQVSSHTKFTFNRHQGLRLGGGPADRGRVVSETASSNAYAAIMSTLRTDVANASKPRRLGGAGWTSKTESGLDYGNHDLFSPLKGTSIRPAPTNHQQTFSKPLKTANVLDDRPSLLAPSMKPESNGFRIKRLGRNDSKTDTLFQPRAEQQPLPATTKQQQQEVPARPSTPEMETPIKITHPSPMHEASSAADAIIASAVAATPLPLPAPKQHLSLTERTRMSLAFVTANANNNINTNKEPPASIDSGLGIPPTISPGSLSEEDDLPSLSKRRHPLVNNGDVQRRVSLYERTRLSLASVPTAAQQPKPRKSTAGNAKRASLFPVNQFETPGRPRGGVDMLGEGRRDGTPAEKLFGEEAEYDSVFKSRPRVAVSPVPFTPEEGAGRPGGGDDDGDSGGEEEEEQGAGSSPLVDRRRRGLVV